MLSRSSVMTPSWNFWTEGCARPRQRRLAVTLARLSLGWRIKLEKIVQSKGIRMDTIRGLLNHHYSCKTFGLAELQNMFGGGESPDMLRCADQNLVNFITGESLQHPSEPSLENILTMLIINQEPVVAMAFPSRKLFPFPEYLGACGRYSNNSYYVIMFMKLELILGLLCSLMPDLV